MLFRSRPALHALFGPDFEPVRTAEKHPDTLVARDRVEHGVAAAGPRVQLEVRFGDKDLQVLSRAAHRGGAAEREEGKEAYQRKASQASPN